MALPNASSIISSHLLGRNLSVLTSRIVSTQMPLEVRVMGSCREIMASAGWSPDACRRMANGEWALSCTIWDRQCPCIVELSPYLEIKGGSPIAKASVPDLLILLILFERACQSGTQVGSPKVENLDRLIVMISRLRSWEIDCSMRSIYTSV
jgi:hypothetical protein